MPDFTLKMYNLLLQSLAANGFSSTSFQHNLQQSTPIPWFILRHDVDQLPYNALEMAYLERSKGIQGTYYFRMVPESYNQHVMEKIAELGHEIGYHYEDVSLAAARQKSKGKRQKLNEEELMELAYESFCKNLETFRNHFDVKTICMHGSPLSPYDNRMIWEKYDYRKSGIIGEPYFDIDFSSVFYLTDTGRRWDGEKVAIRDKVRSQKSKGKSNFTRLRFHSTKDIIKAAEEGKLPDKIMITVHPQRWTDRPLPWLKELIWQNIKNVVKRYWSRMCLF